MVFLLNAGELRERVELQKVESVADGAGGSTRQWVTVKRLSARVLPLNGSEQVVTDGLQPVQGFEIIARHQPAVGIDNRLVWRGQALNIRSAVDPTGKRAWTRIIAEAGVIAA